MLTSIVSFGQNPAETLPNFMFFKLDNTSFTKKNLPDSKQMFFIFFDTTCEDCRETIKTLNNHIKEFKDVAIYLVTLDSQEMIRLFFSEYGKNLLNQKNVVILQDLNNVFIRQFCPIKYPSIFLYSISKKLIFYSDEDLDLKQSLKLIYKNSSL